MPKVQFGISELHIGTYTETTTTQGTTVTLGTPYHQKGAVSFSPEVESNQNDFYADNIVYWSGYSGGKIIHLYHIVLELVRRIEKNDFEGRTLTLKVKFARMREQAEARFQSAERQDFQQITRSITVDHILRTKDEILPLAKQLMQGVEFHSHPIRLLGLGVSGQKSTAQQNQQQWVELELEFLDWPSN